MDFKERFEAKFEKVPGGCWLWKASTSRKGYGQIGHKGKIRIASRVAFELYVGEIPKGALVLHSCDTPSCVNPLHLFLGTDQSNSDDKRAKGRGPVSFITNAKLTAEQVREARLLYATGKFTQKVLAAKYGMCKIAIGKMLRKQTYSEVL